MKNKNNCTACGACLNICPKQAIEMIEDEYGFVFPVIDKEKCINCGLCNSICEKNSSLAKNYPQKQLAIQSKDIDVNRKSSSGGMFAELAKYVLAQNGIVFGCAMERAKDKFEIKHIYIDKKEDLYKLQGSKYVQSDIGETYKQAKEFLQQKILVLYSGTPCQIAGLRAYLNKDYENLLCVDLSCEGVPSAKMFNDYIKFLEEKYKQPVIKFDFRNKEKLGWGCGNAFITLKNGSRKIIHNNESSYLNLFINGGIHRNSCYNCEYTGLNRISDITIADAWGLEEEYPDLLKTKFVKDKGVSLVLINTNKGAVYFEKIKENIVNTEVSAELLKRYNGPLREPIKLNETSKQYLQIYKDKSYTALDKEFKKNQGRKYYYNILKSYTPKFVKNIIKSFITKEEKYDCALMLWIHGKNYGSILTGFALKRCINILGYSAAAVGYYKDNKEIALEFNKKYKMYLDKKFVSIKDLKEINKITNTYIIGSDNQLNINTNGKNVYLPLGFYLDDKIKKAIISGSFGFEKINATPIEIETMKTLYKRFDYLSTREYNGVDIFKDIFDCQAEWVIDPVFLLDKSEYKNIASASDVSAKNKIFSYILYPTDETNRIVEKVKSDTKKEIIDFTGNDMSLKDLKNKKTNVEDWLKGIIDSDIIISDSFHCICFALIFNKPFICLKNFHGFIRFKSLFKMFELSDVITEDSNDIKYIQCNEQRIKTIIKKYSDLEKAKLKEILSKPKTTTKEQAKANSDLNKLSKKELHTNFWYKENKLFYYFVIIPFVRPFKKVLRNLKCKK